MPMTSRERVLRTVEFRNPDRVPRDLWVLPVARIEHGAPAIDAFIERWPTDFVQCTAGRPAPLRKRGDPFAAGTSVDEWGCVFENLKPGIMGEVKRPILDDWAKLAGYSPPMELLQVDRAAVDAFCRSTDRFVFASGWARPFERLQYLRGTENVYADLGEDSDGLHACLKMLHEYFLAQYQLWARTDVDALAIMDDWGAQRSLLISPKQWRRLFKPMYAEYVKIAHDHGKKMFMHSDGNIQAIYPDLVEIGIDALNSQIFCMDMDELARIAKGRMTFWGEIDRQQVIPYGTIADARAAVRRVVDTLWSPAGGCIAQFDFTGGAKYENCEAIFAAWDEFTAAR